MNQKGEATLLSAFMLMALCGLFVLLSLELRSSFNQLNRRTRIFLCAKEVKGELNLYMKFMGRSNWGIKNLNRVSLIAFFIPGLQAIALNTHKVKKFLVLGQKLRTFSYLNSLYQIRSKGCPLDPRMVMTPFVINAGLLKQDIEGAAILRKKKWSYYFYSKPYVLGLTVQAAGYESIFPMLGYKTEEKGGKLHSLLSLH